MQTVTITKDFIIKHLIFLMILVFGFGAVTIARGIKTETVETSIYCVDAEMLRLIPVRTSIPKMPAKKTAQYVLDKMIEGYDDNPKIRRIIPKDEHCLKVSVKDNIAYVDISGELIENTPDGRDMEMLMVYSIVNSLTEIDGIVNVRFTIDGRVQKDFVGYLDMRETFIPDYFV